MFTYITDRELLDDYKSTVKDYEWLKASFAEAEKINKLGKHLVLLEKEIMQRMGRGLKNGET